MSINLSTDGVLVVDGKALEVAGDEPSTAYQLTEALTCEPIPLENWLAIQGKTINTQTEGYLSIENLIISYLKPSVNFFDQQSLLKEFEELKNSENLLLREKQNLYEWFLRKRGIIQQIIPNIDLLIHFALYPLSSDEYQMIQKIKKLKTLIEENYLYNI